MSVVVAGSIAVENIRGLRYEQGFASKAVFPQPVLRIPFGSEEKQVGGIEQDKDRISEGVPFGFWGEKDGTIWILDTINQACKRFASDGQVLTQLNFSNFATGKSVIIKDFAYLGSNTFFMYWADAGEIIKVASTGRIVLEIEGLHETSGISCDRVGNVIVKNPMYNSLLKFSQEGKLVERILPLSDLSEFVDFDGVPLGVRVSPHEINLFRAEIASPTWVENSLLRLYLEDELSRMGVIFKGSNIIGTDEVGNIYIETLATNEDGVIFQHCLYRVSRNGEIMNTLNIKLIPHLAPDLPRKMSVTPDGRVLTYYVEDEKYVIAEFVFPDNNKIQQ